MNVTGVLWTLYPLIGILGFFEFLSGLFYLFFCLPFFAFLLPVVSGVISCITSVYALTIQYSTKCELTMQFMSALLSFLLFLSTFTEAACLRRIYSANGADSFCAGILNRTLGSQMACKDALSDLQQDMLTKMGFPDAHNFEIGLTTFLAIVSLIHFCAAVILTTFSAIETRFRLSAPHWQVVFGLATLLISYAYHSYCCIFFFAYFPTIVACFCLAQAAVPWHFREKSVQRQIFSIVGAALSTTLVAVTTLGMLCWFNRNAPIDDKSPGMYRFCTLPSRIYQVCHKSLAFSKPYVWWKPEQIAQETGIVQIATYALLTITGFIHFGLFMHDAFGST
ncbi:unnamed protein product [Bursaphelenchus xylophilus]|uniref:(pine wood nematode) hypothetical protein n=1 Tax=Bursaphelenchus xylophilus TaxID=6326 RepID=A0A1I7RTF9_BURXY|nr:unnamed protein product [Bursaphelenchus xylophilus]CAG9122469.1 unnamed protein product [Bursaphelenchus xylophilus]